ncbi:MAG: hypothetical protein MH204_09920 [Fimbriimonadaceae bacterium]|nr:hypothetical protein [Fimbriimonadaceae bacterium]
MKEDTPNPAPQNLDPETIRAIQEGLRIAEEDARRWTPEEVREYARARAISARSNMELGSAKERFVGRLGVGNSVGRATLSVRDLGCSYRYFRHTDST